MTARAKSPAVTTTGITVFVQMFSPLLSLQERGRPIVSA